MSLKSTDTEMLSAIKKVETKPNGKNNYMLNVWYDGDTKWTGFRTSDVEEMISILKTHRETMTSRWKRRLRKALHLR